MLEAWRAWGAGALERFRGMFAFALFDERTGSLVLARDQLGIKPLYYLHRDGSVVFASELKALAGVVGHELEIDLAHDRRVDALLLGPRPALRVQGRREAAAGHVGRVPPRRLARACTATGSIAEVAAEAAAGPPADLGAVIEDSVAAHLVADVPVSTFLSGGLDSSIVSVLAKRHNEAIDAYTITFRPEDQLREAMPDDAIYARKVAAQYGIDAARDRDRARRRRAAAAHDRHPRRADRRPRRDQHRADLRGRARRRSEGAAVGHGRRRALRRLPQAPRVRHRGALPAPAPGAAQPR